jgi:hypothetical protein
VDILRDFEKNLKIKIQHLRKAHGNCLLAATRYNIMHKIVKEEIEFLVNEGVLRQDIRNSYHICTVVGLSGEIQLVHYFLGTKLNLENYQTKEFEFNKGAL